MNERPKMVILVGIDGSEPSLQAARFTGRLASTLEADVVAVHAVGLLDVWPEHPWDHTKRNSHARVTELANSAWVCGIREHGVKPNVLLRDGPPAPVILAAAEECNADMIVVGRRGSGSGNVELYALGSTTAQLTKRSTRPVVVVPGDAVTFTGLEYHDDCTVDHRHPR